MSVFEDYLDSVSSDGDSEEVLDGLIDLAAEFFIRHACNGFGISWEDALELVKKQEGLTDEEKARREIIVAAIENLVDFAVVKEYQMQKSLPEPGDDGYEEGSDIYNEALDICNLYNNVYGCTEDLDIEDAMAIAAGWVKLEDSAVLTYETQNDDRVRPWHAAYEGFSAPKFSFPDWLIPPIEHGCRCFLIDDSGDAILKTDLSKIQGKVVQVPQMPDWFNKTFKESVAKGGRIFSEDHRYFTVDKEDIDRLEEKAKKIKSKYFND